MQLEPRDLIGIAALAVTIIGLLAQRFTSIAQIMMRLSILETRMGLVWNFVEQKLALMLKMPTHRELDRLLDKLKEGTITREESEYLYRLIEVRKQELAREGGQEFLLAIADVTQRALESKWLEWDQVKPPSWWQRFKAMWWYR